MEADALMMDGTAMGVPLDNVAHIIQVALTPVFLLSGIGSLLNVITTRLGRVADQSDLLTEALRSGGGGGDADAMYARLVRLRRRLRALDAARAFGALAGAAICAATFVLFLGGLQDAAVATALFVSFGLSVLCTMASLMGFFAETMLSWPRALPPLARGA